MLDGIKERAVGKFPNEVPTEIAAHKVSPACEKKI